MARLTDMPNEIMTIILKFYFMGQTVRHHRYHSWFGIPSPSQSKLLAMLSVCKRLLNRRQVADMILRYATFRVTYIHELARLASISDSQKALVRHLQTWDEEPDTIELPYAFRYPDKNTYRLLSKLRLVTIKDWQITLEVDETSKLFRKSQHSTASLPVCKNYPACTSTIHLQHNPMDGNASLYDLTELELDLRCGIRYDTEENSVQFGRCVDYRLFNDYGPSDSFLAQAPDNGVEIVLEDIEIRVCPEWDNHCSCAVVFKDARFSNRDMILRIPVGDQSVLIPQIFLAARNIFPDSLPPVWPRRHLCYDGLSDVLGYPLQRP